MRLTPANSLPSTSPSPTSQTGDAAQARWASSLPESSVDVEQLPDYADALLAYHRSHAATLDAMIARLPIEVGHEILDVATGDGTYALLMARRGAIVKALDQDPNYLSLAVSRAKRRSLPVEAVRADACELPFPSDHFDGVFCAQSFYSISNVSRVLEEMRRVVKPGGWVGVLENDSLHHVLLPWAPELELAIRLGQYTGLSTRTNQGERFYIGRHLFTVMREAGFEGIQEASFATQHSAPLSEDAHAFLKDYACGVVDQARLHLAPEVLQAALSSCNPASPHYLFTRPDFSATVLDLLVWGRKPSSAHKRAVTK